MKTSHNTPVTYMTISEMKERFNLSEEDVKALENIEQPNSMNKINEIKLGLSLNYLNTKHSTLTNVGMKKPVRHDFQDGFDACMALELPVKFAEWCWDCCFRYIDGTWTISKIDFEGSIKEVFTYWLENVYKEEKK